MPSRRPTTASCNSPCAGGLTCCRSAARFNIASGGCEDFAEVSCCDIDQSSGRAEQRIGVAYFAGSYVATISKALADDRKVRAVVCPHRELLDPHADPVFDDWKATDHRASVRHERLRIVQGRAAIEANAEQ